MRNFKNSSDLSGLLTGVKSNSFILYYSEMKYIKNIVDNFDLTL